MRRVFARWAVFGAMLLVAATAVGALARASNLASSLATGAHQQAGRNVGLAVAATPTKPSGSISHVVKRGETLSMIALKYDISVWDIADYNDILSPDRIYAGQVLLIPLPVKSTPTRTPSTPVWSCLCEEIVITSPSRGMTITNPITVSGVASSPFEQTVAAIVLDGAGAQIGVASGAIQGEVGERGPFTISVSFSVPLNSQPGRIQVFTESPRDGAMEHLTSVTVNIQGLELDALLERLDAAVSAKDYASLKSMMGQQFRSGSYRAAGNDMSAAQAIELLQDSYLGPGSPRLDFSADARRFLGANTPLPADVIHVVFSTGWGANRDDDAFLLFSPVAGRATWRGMIYVAHDLIDYR